MKSFMPVFFIALLNGCSFYSMFGMNNQLFDTEQQVVQCEYELALDTLQKYTVVGSESEKAFSLELMGVIYQEKGEVDEFEHTVDRFLFSKMGRGADRAVVIEKWTEKARKIRNKRVYEIDVLECETRVKPVL